MQHLVPRAFLALSGLTCACIASAQFGGFGGDRSEDENNGSDRFSDETLDGSWTMEFELVFDAARAGAAAPFDAGAESSDAIAEDETVTVRADVSLMATQVTGRFRNPAVGEFSCTMYEGSARCENGRMVILWPDADYQEVMEFAFTVNSVDRRQARGEAHFFNHGMLVMYDVHMKKR